MIRTIIIDDEQHSINNLRKLLQNNCPGLTMSGEALNADDGEKIILEETPDIVFLDIQMPGRSGFDMLKSLHSYSFEIIFVTAFDKYGIQAVKFAAIDYLLKPINVEELKTAVSKASERVKQKKQNLQLENLLQLLKHNQQKEDHRIALPTLKEIRFAKTADIIRCESSNNYTIFFLVNEEKLVVSRPIYEYEELLSGYGFIRCHQSHLINRIFIKSMIKEDGGYLLLEDESQIPISRQKKEEIKSLLGKRI